MNRGNGVHDSTSSSNADVARHAHRRSRSGARRLAIACLTGLTGLLGSLPTNAFALTGAAGADGCGNKPAPGTIAGMSRADIIYINWDGEIDPWLDSQLPIFYQELAASDYMEDVDFMYGGGLGGGLHSYLGEYTLVPQTYIPRGCTVANPCTLTQSQVATELGNAVSNGNWPTSNVVYMIHLPPNINLIDGGGTQQCAFHASVSTGILGLGTPIIYGIMSDFTASTSFCFTAGYQQTDTATVNNVTFAASHEFIEAYVDPTKGNKDLEIGDACDCAANFQNGVAWMTFQGATRFWFVQQPWEADAQTCFAGSDPLPSAIDSGGRLVSRTPNNLDGFYSTVAGTVSSSAWSTTSGWQDFNVATGGRVVQNSAIAATARTANNIDIFYIGSDGALWSNAWQAGVGWKTFSLSGTNLAPPGSSLTALTRAPESLDVFVVDNSGNLDRFAWNGSTWTLSFAGASDIQPGAGVAAVARTTQNLDVFFIGKDGILYTTFLQPGMSSWGRLQLPFGELISGSPVAATARAWSNLDVYFTDEEGGLDHAWWNTDNGWQNETTGFLAPLGAQLAAVARYPTNQDIFFADSKGLENVWWHASNPWGETNALSASAEITLTPGQSLGAAARTPNNLDVYEVGLLFGAVTIPAEEFWSAGNAWGLTP